MRSALLYAMSMFALIPPIHKTIFVASLKPTDTHNHSKLNIVDHFIRKRIHNFVCMNVTQTHFILYSPTIKRQVLCRQIPNMEFSFCIVSNSHLGVLQI